MKQRELKFRAWDRVNRKMYDVLTIAARACFIEVHEPELEKARMITLPDFDPMQFIGFSDKHEKDIYEGDIVKIKNPKHDGYRVVLIEADEDTSSWPVWKMHKQFVEVIGNIFENPELLA